MQYGDNFILYFRIGTFVPYKEKLSYILYSIEYLTFPYGYGKKCIFPFVLYKDIFD